MNMGCSVGRRGQMLALWRVHYMRGWQISSQNPILQEDSPWLTLENCWFLRTCLPPLDSWALQTGVFLCDAKTLLVVWSIWIFFYFIYQASDLIVGVLLQGGRSVKLHSDARLAPGPVCTHELHLLSAGRTYPHEPEAATGRQFQQSLFSELPVSAEL